MKNKDFIKALADLIGNYLDNEDEIIDWLISRGWNPHYSVNVTSPKLSHSSFGEDHFSIKDALFYESMVLTEEVGITNIGGESERFLNSNYQDVH